jgi:hypothetical protein
MQLQTIARFACVLVAVLLVYASLGPAKWQLRPLIGWKTEHFLTYFFVCLGASVAWSRQLLVCVISVVAAFMLEALQGLTLDRIPDLPTNGQLSELDTLAIKVPDVRVAISPPITTHPPAKH